MATFMAWGRARFAVSCVLLGALAGCRGSSLSDKFYYGAKRQEGLDNYSLYLWDRSPALASGNARILSTANFDSEIAKTIRYFSNIQNVSSALRSSDLIIQYSHIDASAPTFFKWAGRRVPWKDNPDFRALFVYSELDRGIAYVDALMDSGYLVEDPAKLFAWRQAVCTGQTRGSRSCSSAGDIIAAPVLPLYVTVDNETLPEGQDSSVTDAGFCPFFNSQHHLTADPPCVTRTGAAATWKTDWHAGRLSRQISFYRDYEYTRFNFADDGDVALHELAHVLQAAIQPDLLETDPGSNFHLDAIIEGSADFFSAAYRRDDRVFRYAVNNLYPIFPSQYFGSLAGKDRDPANSLYLPDAYLNRSAYDLGRVLSGTLNDYRKALNGQTIGKLVLSTDISGLLVADTDDIDGDGNTAEITAPKYASSEAWDMAVGVLFQTFYELDPVADLAVSLQRFSGRLVEVCSTMGTACEPTLLQQVLENRGLLLHHYFVPAKVDIDPTGQLYDSTSAEGTANDFLFKLGKSNLSGDEAELRWGLNMGETLGWAPFMPGGSVEFANDDGVLNPCETIVVFPKIYNNTDEEYWKDKTGARANAGAGFTAHSGYITGYETILPATRRGLDVIDLKWSMGAGPMGFINFVHPTLGAIDPYSGVNENDVRGIPFLKPGEDAETLIRNQSGRLYKVYQEKAFDLPWTSKVVTNPSKRARLRSAAGWIFQLPDTAADPDIPSEKSAEMTFKISYSVYNSKFLRKFSDIYMFEGSPAVLTLSDTVTQSLRVSDVDAGFCD